MTTATEVKRKYALTRIQKGDYLFPSNDGAKLWRVYTYLEDRSLYTGETQVKGTFWAVARFTGTVDEAQRLLETDPDVLLDWTEWEFWAGPLKTREEAIREAIRTMT